MYVRENKKKLTIQGNNRYTSKYIVLFPKPTFIQYTCIHVPNIWSQKNQFQNLTVLTQVVQPIWYLQGIITTMFRMTSTFDPWPWKNIRHPLYHNEYLYKVWQSQFKWFSLYCVTSCRQTYRPTDVYSHTVICLTSFGHIKSQIKCKTNRQTGYAW